MQAQLKCDRDSELRKAFPDVTRAVSSAQYENATQGEGETVADFWGRLAQLGNNLGVGEEELLRKFRGGLQPALKESLIYLTGTVTVSGLITHLTTVETRMRSTHPPSLAAFQPLFATKCDRDFRVG